MNNSGLILRNIVFFLFPVPFLLSFAIEQGGDWTAYVAYTTVVALAFGGFGRRMGREPKKPLSTASAAKSRLGL